MYINISVIGLNLRVCWSFAYNVCKISAFSQIYFGWTFAQLYDSRLHYWSLVPNQTLIETLSAFKLVHNGHPGTLQNFVRARQWSAHSEIVRMCWVPQIYQHLTDLKVVIWHSWSFSGICLRITQTEFSLLLFSEKVNILNDLAILQRVILKNFLIELWKLPDCELMGLLVEGQWTLTDGLFDFSRTSVHKFPRSNCAKL